MHITSTMGRTCVVLGCSSRQKDVPRRSFYSFPLEETRCKQWLRAAGRSDLLNEDPELLRGRFWICDRHFGPSDIAFRNVSQYAVPTLNLPPVDKLSNSNDSATQTDLSLCLSCLDYNPCNISSQIKSSEISVQTAASLEFKSPRIRKLMRELTLSNKKVKELEKIVIHMRNRSTKIKGQNLTTNKKGNRYDQDFKKFAMSMYSANPTAYCALSQTQSLHLPAERTLRRMRAKIGTTRTNTNETTTSKVKVTNMTNKDA